MFYVVVLLYGVALGIWAFLSPQPAATTLVASAYLVGCFVFVQQWAIRPRPRPDFTELENYLYRKCSGALLLPAGAAEIGRVINAFRLMGLLAIPWLAWNQLWVHAGLMVAYYFLVNSMCIHLNPGHYYGAAAAKGNLDAQVCLATLIQVQRRLGL